MKEVLDDELVRRRGEVTRRLLLVGGVFALCLAMSACHRADGRGEGLKVRHTIAPMPVRVGHSRLDLELVRAGGANVSGAQIQVELDMAHPGMAPRFSIAKEDSAGHYSTDLDLDMAGDWVVVVHTRLLDGQQVERQFALNGVQP